MGRWSATVPPGRGRGDDLGGAHERAAHDNSFAARRDVRELLFDVALVDGAVALEDALALRGAALYYRDVAARRRRPHFRLLVPTGRGYDGVLVRVIDCIRVEFDGQAPRPFRCATADRTMQAGGKFGCHRPPHSSQSSSVVHALQFIPAFPASQDAATAWPCSAAAPSTVLAAMAIPSEGSILSTSVEKASQGRH